jgi:hypothetical protein
MHVRETETMVTEQNRIGKWWQKTEARVKMYIQGLRHEGRGNDIPTNTTSTNKYIDATDSSRFTVYRHS